MVQIVSSIQHDKVVYDKRKYDMELYLRNIDLQRKSIKKN
jgi:hypothetical protein